LTRLIALAPHADGIIIDDFDDEAARGLRTRLSALTRMLAVQLRLLQFEVADAIEEGPLAGTIAKRLMEEVTAIDHNDLQAMMVHIATSKFLMAESAEIGPAERISYALAFRGATPRTLALAEGKIADPMMLLPAKLKLGMDMADFLFSMIVRRIASSDEELEVFRALDAISANVRNGFLDAMSAIYEGSAVFVHSGWSRDEREGRDMTVALDKYGQIEPIAGRWNRPDVCVEIICARSIILDESLKRFGEAIVVIDEAISNHGSLPALIRQKSKILGHAGRDPEAVDLLIRVEDEVGGRSPFDRSLALRDGAMSAAIQIG
jgi:hypothetical protein